MSSSAASFSAAVPTPLPFAAQAGFGLATLRTASPLAFQLLPGGTVHAVRHGPTLVNQLLAGPAEDGLFRLLLRVAETGTAGAPARWAPVVGAGLPFAHSGSAAWWWSELGALRCIASLELHPTLPAWAWRLRVVNAGGAPCRVDALLAQDLGLGDEAAVRNNEAYCSHYIDLLPVRDGEWGWAVLARQNQAMAGGRHPWLAHACATGAQAFCTDGWQFFGADHRLTGRPAAAAGGLPSQRLQYEFALAGLQSRPAGLAPGGACEFLFLARFLEDHPGASDPADLSLLRECVPALASPPAPPAPGAASPRSLLQAAPWLHGDEPSEAELAAWFPGPHRHAERSDGGGLLSFFCGADTHVACRAKEASIARPHGHILRSGDWRWFDDEHFGVTCYAAGLFGAQAYLGHPSFARLLSVARNALNVARGGGQRVFVRRAGEWRQLGVPSAFAMTPGEARWLYRMGGDLIEARVWCGRDVAASFLSLRVLSGAPCEFLVSHEVVAGSAEYDLPSSGLVHDPEGWVALEPSPDSLVGRHMAGLCLAVASADPAAACRIDGDAALHGDGVGRGGPYLTFRSGAVASFGIVLTGSRKGPASLPVAVAAARALYARGGPASRAPSSPVRLRGGGDAGVERVDEVLPWFAHNATVHFSAPHGLEQYGGAAWGVRDVCQGSIEWLLSAGDHRGARRVLETVFAQQYQEDGGWPQWFMFPPYSFIQQAHSHGDVCFWPVKALCDYLEASNDLAFLGERIGYTDRSRFVPREPAESVLAHCDRVVDQCESRFLPGSALVNYGDGDWDDTLQPADPAMRTRMVSAWTVGLAFQTFRQFAEVCRRAGEPARAERLGRLCEAMRRDFAARLMPGGVVAGFLVAGADGVDRPLLHPSDELTGIAHRLLPMTRSVIAELFTPEEARRHLRLVAEKLAYPDGVRLMSSPTPYRGGLEHLFRRAETAANVGREIGLQYVHAHLRYAEALAKTGDAEGLWKALQVVNPVALREVVPQAAPRQSNVYFSSSDADFADREEASRRWHELREGGVPVRGGWRLYSSGPGLFVHKVRSCLLGLRESFDEVVFDPVLCSSLDGLVAATTLCGKPVQLLYRVFERTSAPRAVTVNGLRFDAARRDANPYRAGGLVVRRAELEAVLGDVGNVILVEL